VTSEVKASPTPTILFIDEAHTLIGAGAPAGQSDAANLLKPALARGEVRTIAATTWAEYKKYFEQDPALTRRFQMVKVEEPDEDAAIDMMRGLVSKLEAHHKVRILDDAVCESVRLSTRYIPARQLPDKCVSLLDTACARVAMSQTAVPPAVDDRRRRLQRLNGRLFMLRREQASGGKAAEDVTSIEAEIAKTQADLQYLEAQWERERALVADIRALCDLLEDGSEPAAQTKADPPADLTAKHGQDGAADGGAAPAEKTAATEYRPSQPPATREEQLTMLHCLEGELAQAQGEMPLIRASVDGQAVAEVVGTWTGIPVGRMVMDEIRMLENLEEAMAKRIKGQPYALAAIARAVRTSRAKLTDPRKPVGVFLMVGTSGVGKTETALCLADLLYGGEHNITVINMSEFKEQHRVSMLTGAPPGYKGYEEGGVLTEAVRRRPHSIILLDEVEKAHRGVQDVFYDVFDKGMLRDGQGREIDFKNTIIIMTSNAAADVIAEKFADQDCVPDVDVLVEGLRPYLLRVFDAPFLGRTTIVPYLPLGPKILREIVVLQMSRIRDRVRNNYKADLTYDDALIGHVVERCAELESGARNVEAILRGNLLPDLSKQFLARMADGAPITSLHVSLNEHGSFAYAMR
jgi:type VI secretion system protein VasG